MKTQALIQRLFLAFTGCLMLLLSGCMQRPPQPFTEITESDMSADHTESEVTSHTVDTKTAHVNDSEYITTAMQSITGTEAITETVLTDTEPYETVRQNRSNLNIKATVRAASGLVLREEPSTNSRKKLVIPNKSTVTILSAADSFLIGYYNQMVYVRYMDQYGYVSMDYLQYDPVIDISSYSKEETLDMGKIWFLTLYQCDWSVLFLADFDYYITDETINISDGPYGVFFQRMEPAGLTLRDIHRTAERYYSKNVDWGIEDDYLERDGYLWTRVLEVGSDVWLDHYEVTDIIAQTKTELTFQVLGYYDEFHLEPGEDKTFTLQFSLVLEDGAWKFKEHYFKVLNEAI